MKKLFLLAAFSFVAFVVKAQDLNFEETVKYIKSKLADSKIIYWSSSNYGFTQNAGNIQFDKTGTISPEAEARKQNSSSIFLTCRRKKMLCRSLAIIYTSISIKRNTPVSISI